MKSALIFGITGQIGSYLAELLIARGYHVVGVVRRASTINTSRIDHLYSDQHDGESTLRLVYGDVLDGESIGHILRDVRPTEIYNLAAQSHVRVSFDQPTFTADVVALGAMRIFEAVRRYCPEAHVYQASSSELFGNHPAPQDELTTFDPRSPYACAKAFAYHAAVNYREAFGLFIANGICFNTESERRGETFVTRKVTRAVGRIAHGLQEKLYLGNLHAERDWTYAPEIAEAIWRSLQHEAPEDFAFGSGKSHTVEWWVDTAFKRANLFWPDYVEIDKRYMRPTEVNRLRANPIRAEEELGWKATLDAREICHRMVDHDMKLAKREIVTRQLDNFTTNPKIVPGDTFRFGDPRWQIDITAR